MVDFKDLKRRTLAHMGVPCNYNLLKPGERCYSCESREQELDELLIAFAREIGSEEDPESYLFHLKRGSL